MNSPIKPRERDAILQSLRAGVVPRVGLRHLQVGRKDEVAAVLDAKVAVSPGVGFGDHGDDYVRFALIENEHRTRQATRSIAHFFKEERDKVVHLQSDLAAKI